MTKVKNLVPLPREVHCDTKGWKEMKPILRFDAKLEDNDVKLQILVDLRHKDNPRLSKPKAYVTLSQPRQFEDLITATLAMACLHRLRNYAVLTKDQILACYDEIVKWNRDDVATLSGIIFKEVKQRARLVG